VVTKLERRVLSALQSERAREVRTRIALWTLVASGIGWPVAALTVARNEPQFVLGLSFLAITFTAWDILTSSQIYEESNGD
jgi:uncharacterized membrane protein YfcA